MSSTDHSGISSADTSPVRKHFPVNALVASTPENERKSKDLVSINNEKNITATTGPDKFKRISQLAESVFGDTIVQKGNQRSKVKKTESVCIYYFLFLVLLLLPVFNPSLLAYSGPNIFLEYQGTEPYILLYNAVFGFVFLCGLLFVLLLFIAIFKNKPVSHFQN